MTVVLCTWGDALEGGTEEALTLAGQHSTAIGADLHWLVIGGAAAPAHVDNAVAESALTTITLRPEAVGLGPVALGPLINEIARRETGDTDASIGIMVSDDVDEGLAEFEARRAPVFRS